MEAGVRDRESADLLPCYLYPKEYFNKPSMCVSLDAYSSCLCLKISKRTSFTRSPGAFLKVMCLELRALGSVSLSVYKFEELCLRDFPGGPMVHDLSSNAGDMG